MHRNRFSFKQDVDQVDLFCLEQESSGQTVNERCVIAEQMGDTQQSGFQGSSARCQDDEAASGHGPITVSSGDFNVAGQIAGQRYGRQQDETETQVVIPRPKPACKLEHHREMTLDLTRARARHKADDMLLRRALAGSVEVVNQGIAHTDGVDSMAVIESSFKREEGDHQVNVFPDEVLTERPPGPDLWRQKVHRLDAPLFAETSQQDVQSGIGDGDEDIRAFLQNKACDSAVGPDAGGDPGRRIGKTEDGQLSARQHYPDSRGLKLGTADAYQLYISPEWLMLLEEKSGVKIGGRFTGTDKDFHFMSLTSCGLYIIRK